VEDSEEKAPQRRERIEEAGEGKAIEIRGWDDIYFPQVIYSKAGIRYPSVPHKLPPPAPDLSRTAVSARID
jgi:hypothetical protein